MESLARQWHPNNESPARPSVAPHPSTRRDAVDEPEYSRRTPASSPEPGHPRTATGRLPPPAEPTRACPARTKSLPATNVRGNDPLDAGVARSQKSFNELVRQIAWHAIEQMIEFGHVSTSLLQPRHAFERRVTNLKAGQINAKAG